MGETIDQIKIDEGGYQAEVYLCTEGKRTWLYGRNISDRPITEEEWLILEDLLKHEDGGQYEWAGILFGQELARLRRGLNAYAVYFDEMPEEVATIILNMTYNMGITRFNPDKWPKFFVAIKNKDWKQAAIEGRDSKWFTQVGRRSKRLMNSLENVA